MADFLMPALGADMETGTVVQWLVRPGERVKRGDVVAVVETHKGAIDVEIFLDGVIDELVPLGQALPVGAVLARVRTEGEAEAGEVAAGPGSVPTAPSGAVSSLPAAHAPQETPLHRPAPQNVPERMGDRVRASPAARRRAGELGMGLQGLVGSGVEGAVTLADVEQAAAAPHGKEAALVGDKEGGAVRRGFDVGQMRHAIALAMVRSKREIPHYYLGATIDFSAADAWLAAHNRDALPEQRLLPAVLLLKATALALREVPKLNGFYDNGEFRAGAGIHPGWAIALRGGGLVAPAVHDADRQALPDLMAALRDLVQRARSGGLRSSEFTDPTITVTSLGDRGAETVYGVIYPPQVAIVGFGKVVQRPWVVEDRVEPRLVVQASLSGDHRASDGHLGGQLLTAIDRLLQSPEQL